MLHLLWMWFRKKNTHFLLQVCSIEQELNYLQKLNHENLVQYVSMKYVQENGCLVIYILQVIQLHTYMSSYFMLIYITVLKLLYFMIVFEFQEFVIGINLAFYLMENLPVDADLLRHYSAGILCALAYLHSNNVVHKDLRDTSVFIGKSGEHLQMISRV